jgi:hypothetical protein
MKMEAIRSSETSVHTRIAQCHIPEDDILQYEVCLPPAFTLVSCLVYSTLKMEVTCSSEASLHFQRTTWR